jgi:hypothetical protein
MPDDNRVGTGAVVAGAPAIIAISKILTEIVDMRIRAGTTLLFDPTNPPHPDLIEGVIQAVIVVVVLPIILYARNIARFFGRIGEFFLRRWLKAHNIPDEVLEDGQQNPKE